MKTEPQPEKYTQNSQNRGPRSHRIGIFALTATLAVLSYWLLAYLMRDIGNWPAPPISDFERNTVDRSLVGRKQGMDQQLRRIQAQISDQTKRPEETGSDIYGSLGGQTTRLRTD